MKVTIEINLPKPNKKMYHKYLKQEGLEDTLENLVNWGLAIQYWGFDLDHKVLKVEE